MTENSQTPSVQYAGFWKRFCAILIDVLIAVLIATPLFFLEGRHPAFPYFSFFILVFGMAIYHIHFVKVFGGTLGKLAMKIVIRKVDGSAIGHKEATLRYLPEGIFGMLNGIASLIAHSKIPIEELAGLGILERSKALQANYPSWHFFVTIASFIWFYSEPIVMLTNKKRRAIHDFIADTIVVRK